MNNVFVVLPAYNEEFNISKVIKDWKDQGKEFIDLGYLLKIVVIDDCSFDNTFNQVKEFSRNNDNIVLIRHIENKGLGGALKTGIDYALENSNENDVLYIMDSDFTHKAKYSIEMIKNMKEYSSDVVIASRFQNGSKIFGVPKHRQLLSFFAKKYYSMSLRIKNVRDYTCGYRLYKISYLKRIKDIYKDDYISEMDFTCMVEILFKLHYNGAIFSEIPFSLHYDERRGESKMKIIKTSINSFKIPFYIKKLAEKTN